MDKDFSRLPSMWDKDPPDRPDHQHYYDPRFNTKTDRKRDPAPTHIRYDPALGRFVESPGSLPSKRSGNSKANRKRAERLALRDTGWHCYWCGIKLSYDIEGGDTKENRTRLDVRYPTIDHVIELANGGPDTDENCVLSCQPCNSDRNKTFNDRRPDVF